MLTAAFFRTAPSWSTNPSAHPEENREVKWGGHSVEYYVTRNKDKLPVFVTMWMKLTGTIPSETSMFQNRWNSTVMREV